MAKTKTTANFQQFYRYINQDKSESESRLVVSNSLWPHGLDSPWNSPGQNTGVDSLPLLQGISPTQELNPGLPHCRPIFYHLSHQGSREQYEVKWKRSVLSDSLWPHGLDSPWNFPVQNTGVGSLSLLQGIFPTQGWNLGLLFYQLSHKGIQEYWSG